MGSGHREIRYRGYTFPANDDKNVRNGGVVSRGETYEEKMQEDARKPLCELRLRRLINNTLAKLICKCGVRGEATFVIFFSNFRRNVLQIFRDKQDESLFWLSNGCLL